MFTEEDIDNLAQFMYLSECQYHWENGLHFLKKDWSDVDDFKRELLRIKARVAFDFMKPKLLIDVNTPEGKDLLRELHDRMHKL